MTPEARKARTEALLEKEGIPFLSSLPCVESEEETQLRLAEEVGMRITCLFCVVGSAFDLEDNVFRAYLKKHDLWNHLTPNETSFLADAAPERRSVIQFTWRSEAVFLLMWAARLFDVLPLPRQEIVTDEIVRRFPEVDDSPWVIHSRITPSQQE